MKRNILISLIIVIGFFASGFSDSYKISSLESKIRSLESSIDDLESKLRRHDHDYQYADDNHDHSDYADENHSHYGYAKRFHSH